MMVRRLYLVLVLIAGLFVFQGTMAEALPREKARTEVVFRIQKQAVHEFIFTPKTRSVHFVVSKSVQKAQVEKPLLLSLILSCQQHHSSL